MPKKQKQRAMHWLKVFVASVGVTSGFIFFALVIFLTLWQPVPYARALHFIAQRGWARPLLVSQANITRGQFTELVTTAVGSHASVKNSNDCFADLSAQSSSTIRAICAAQDQGWLDTFPSNQFHPDDPVTFIEGLRIVMAGFHVSTSSADAPWYKQLIDEASAKNFIPLTITDFEQPLSYGEAADLLARIITSREGKQAAYLGSKAPFRVTYQTLTKGQNVFSRARLGGNQCFSQGLYRDNHASFSNIESDNSCSSCVCSNGKTICRPMSCKPPLVEEIRPDKTYAFPFKVCDSSVYQQASISILDTWSNLADLKQKVDAIPNGRAYIADVLKAYDVCLSSHDKTDLLERLAAPYNLSKDDKPFLQNLAHVLFVFQQPLFDHLDYQKLTKEEVGELGWNKQEYNWTLFDWSSTSFDFSQEYYKLFPLAIQIVDRHDTEEQMVFKLSSWLEGNLMHYYSDSEIGFSNRNGNYTDARYNVPKAYWDQKGFVDFDSFFKLRLGDCHVGSGMLAALARSLGIPVKLGSRAGHGYVEFPRIKRFVHGDMIALPAAWPGEWIVNDQQTWDMKDPYVYYRNQFPQESRLKYLLMMIAPRFVGDDQWRVESSITILTRREQYSQCMMTREEVMRYKDVIAAVFPEFQLKFTNDGCERTVDDAGRFTGDLPHAHADALYRVTSEPIKIKSLEEYYAPQYFVSSTVGHL